jgi:hypothetical protein
MRSDTALGAAAPAVLSKPAIRAMSAATSRVGGGCRADDRVNYGTRENP